uniref:Uncharacterized protein n=1 Tax=Anguilla anguilla TaxID=7936 RepID=A0A0E9PIN6_ANGAN
MDLGYLHAGEKVKERVAELCFVKRMYYATDIIVPFENYKSTGSW